MTRAEYLRQVELVLAEHRVAVAERWTRFLAQVPPTATELELSVFVDQGGEGFLTVRGWVGGPEAHALNRALAGHAVLFDTRMTESGLEPALPLMASGAEEFAVVDALTDCAAAWLAEFCRNRLPDGRELPLTIESPEGYGTSLPAVVA